VRSEVFEYARKVKHHVPIPKGTLPAKCRGPRCNTQVYFVGNRIVSIEAWQSVPEGVAPTKTEDGIGIDHHADCIDRDLFRSKKGK
jgi:hypothetical protein